MTIEKIIHQIWITPSKIVAPVPAKYDKNIESVKKYNPDWQYMLWDENMILELMKANTKWLDTYNKFKYLHQKIDFSKYVILYCYGGAYLDIDVEGAKSLTHLLNIYPGYDLILSYLKDNIFASLISVLNTHIINNGVILCKKNNILMDKFIDAIILEMNKNKTYVSKIYCIVFTTGPAIFTNFFDKNKDNKTLILDNKYLEPCMGSVCNVTNETYTIHQHDATWIPPILKNVRDFVIKNGMCLIIIGVIIAVIIFASRYGPAAPLRARAELVDGRIR